MGMGQLTASSPIPLSSGIYSVTCPKYSCVTTTRGRKPPNWRENWGEKTIAATLATEMGIQIGRWWAGMNHKMAIENNSLSLSPKIQCQVQIPKNQFVLWTESNIVELRTFSKQCQTKINDLAATHREDISSTYMCGACLGFLYSPIFWYLFVSFGYAWFHC